MPEADTTAERIAALERKFDERVETLAERVQRLEAEKRGILDGLAAQTGLSRRQLMAIAATGAGAGAMATYGASEAEAAAQPSGGENDMGTTVNPFEGFADGLAMVAESISTATTVTKPVVRYDPSISGFTITIGQELEGPSGFAQAVVLQEVGGSTNQVTVDTESGNGIDGGSSITISAAGAETVLRWNESEWVATRFIDTANVSTLTADEASINGNQVYVQGSAPGSPSTGDIWIDNDG